MRLAAQHQGLIAYATARLELEVEAERRTTAATGTELQAAAEWPWCAGDAAPPSAR